MTQNGPEWLNTPHKGEWLLENIDAETNDRQLDISSSFSRMNIVVFWLRLHFKSVQHFSIGSANDVLPVRPSEPKVA